MRSVSSLVMAATLARTSGRAGHGAGRLSKLGVERVDGVAIAVEDVLDRFAGGPAPGAAVAAGLLEIVLRQVVENLERLVERILKTSNDRLHVAGLRREVRHASPP